MVIQFQPYQDMLPTMPEPFDPVPYEARNIKQSAAAFMDEIVCAKTSHRCLELRRELSELALLFAALESSALDRADRILKERES